MKDFLLSPPIAFVIVFVFLSVLAGLFSRLSFRPGAKSDNSGKSYACGEDDFDHLAQPDYSNFFPFVFFFTLAHVATLIMTTVPMGNLNIFVIAGVYIIGAIIGLSVLFRK
jgi:hypothetical protein